MQRAIPNRANRTDDPHPLFWVAHMIPEIKPAERPRAPDTEWGAAFYVALPGMPDAKRLSGVKFAPWRCAKHSDVRLGLRPPSICGRMRSRPPVI